MRAISKIFQRIKKRPTDKSFLEFLKSVGSFSSVGEKMF